MQFACVMTTAIRQRLQHHRNLVLDRFRSELGRIDAQSELDDPEQVERATEAWEAQVLTHLSDHDARIIREIDDALHRLDEGVYGLCATCGTSISDARIEALPTASLCIGCADEGRPTGRVKRVKRSA